MSCYVLGGTANTHYVSGDIANDHQQNYLVVVETRLYDGSECVVTAVGNLGLAATSSMQLLIGIGSRVLYHLH